MAEGANSKPVIGQFFSVNDSHLLTLSIYIAVTSDLSLGFVERLTNEKLRGNRCNQGFVKGVESCLKIL